MEIHTLRGPDGMEARITDYGGILLSLLVPDRDGRLADVVLGHDDPAAYRENPDYLGAIIGRYANRIAGGRFTLDGRTHQVATNERGENHLHGGHRGFDAVPWDAEPGRDAAGDTLVLRHTSPDGEEGFPGTLQARVRYTLTARGELIVDYHATTDAATPVNLTHHSYFNLAGRGAGDILDHGLTIEAARFTPVGEDLIPTGELRDVAGTPFDFRRATAIGARIDDDDPQLRIGGGYDHNYVLGEAAGPDGLRRAAVLYHPGSGRRLEIRTTEPGVQLYSGNGLHAPFGPRGGVALETQHFPDSPNHPHFPSTILRPGQTYRSRTVHAFTTSDD